MDRFDCQYLMATFVNVYISSFIRVDSPQKLLQQVKNAVVYTEIRIVLIFSLLCRSILWNQSCNWSSLPLCETRWLLEAFFSYPLLKLWIESIEKQRAFYNTFLHSGEKINFSFLTQNFNLDPVSGSNQSYKSDPDLHKMIWIHNPGKRASL